MAGEDTDPKSSASAAAVLYVFLSFLLKVLPQFLVLVLVLHMLGSTSYMLLAILSALDMIGYGSYMQKLFTFSLSKRMTCFISTILVMLYLVFLLIKSFGKLLIFPTVRTVRGEHQWITMIPSEGVHDVDVVYAALGARARDRWLPPLQSQDSF